MYPRAFCENHTWWYENVSSAVASSASRRARDESGEPVESSEAAHTEDHRGQPKRPATFTKRGNRNPREQRIQQVLILTVEHRHDFVQRQAHVADESVDLVEPEPAAQVVEPEREPDREQRCQRRVLPPFGWLRLLQPPGQHGFALQTGQVYPAQAEQQQGMHDQQTLEDPNPLLDLRE